MEIEFLSYIFYVSYESCSLARKKTFGSQVINLPLSVAHLLFPNFVFKTEGNSSKRPHLAGQRCQSWCKTCTSSCNCSSHSVRCKQYKKQRSAHSFKILLHKMHQKCWKAGNKLVWKKHHQQIVNCPLNPHKKMSFDEDSGWKNKSLMQIHTDCTFANEKEHYSTEFTIFFGNMWWFMCAWSR